VNKYLKPLEKISIKIRQIKVLLEEIEGEYSILKSSEEIKKQNKSSNVFLQTVTSICNRKKITIT